ncbi:MAG: hypothetical protein WBX00_36315, partial [Isosphaeraceae bacterium]
TTGETANQVLATPNGSSGALAVRALAAADIPTLPASQITAPGSSGQLIYNRSNVFTGAADWSIGSSGQLTGTAISDPGTPSAGDLWYSSAQSTFGFMSSGMNTKAGGVIWQGLSAGTAVANTTTQTSLLTGISTTNGSLTIPAGALVPGKIIRPVFTGTMTVGVSTPTLSVFMLLGGTQIWGYTSPALSSTSNAMTFLTHPFSYFKVHSVGSSGTLLGFGLVYIPNGTGETSVPGGSNTGGASTTYWQAPSVITINTTGSLALDLQVKWSAALAANSIQCLDGYVTIDG